MRTCLFCDRTTLNREHVWPDWISKFLFGEPKRGRFTAHRTGTDRKPLGRPFKAPELNHKAKIVCYGCNSGWMNEVESAARPILKPMLRGRAVLLNIEEQFTIRAWIVLRGMVLERGGTAPGARRFYTQDERRTFADIEYEGSLEPLDGTYLWVFHYRSSRWAARSNVANLGLHATTGQPPHHLQVITAFIGQFGFQILIGRWPVRRRLDFNSPHVRDWETATNLLWPSSANLVHWPPSGGYLADDTYEPFTDRFTKGFPLQRQNEYCPNRKGQRLPARAQNSGQTLRVTATHFRPGSDPLTPTRIAVSGESGGRRCADS